MLFYTYNFENEIRKVMTPRVALTNVPYAGLVFLRGPDLSICDSFLLGLRGNLKEKYLLKHWLHIFEELKDRIREEIAAIPVDMCKNVAENFK